MRRDPLNRVSFFIINISKIAEKKKIAEKEKEKIAEKKDSRNGLFSQGTEAIVRHG